MADYKRASATFVPSSGGTVNIPPFDGTVFCCFVDNPGLLASLNISLPAGAMDGQAVRIFFNGAVTLTNVTSVVGLVRGLLGGVLGGQSAVYAWNASTNSWWKG